MKEKYSHWTIIGDYPQLPQFVLCKCDCGTVRPVRIADLKLGKSTCCGCVGRQKTALRNYLNGTHHLKKHPLYNIWSGIKNRCLCKTSKKYKDYGGRGITICKEWEKDFVSFYNWSIKNGYKQGLTIDRIDNNKGYTPQNCRWVDYKIQSLNKRNTVQFIWNGELLPLVIICDKENISCQLVRDRIRQGWNIEKAILTPKKERKNAK